MIVPLLCRKAPGRSDCVTAWDFPDSLSCLPDHEIIDQPGFPQIDCHR